MSPPAYACAEASVGEPTWKQTTSLRFELRHYLVKGVSWNPSFTYAWSGAEVGFFQQKAGVAQLDVPVYVQVGWEKDKALVLGAAFTHKQTWGLGDKNQSDDDLSLFLGGAFELGKL